MGEARTRLGTQHRHAHNIIAYIYTYPMHKKL